MSALIAFALALYVPVAALAQDPPAPPEPAPIALPVADIAITDASGKPVAEEAGLGQLLIVSAAKAVHGGQVGSLVWIVEPSSMQSYASPDGATLIINTGLQPTTLRLMQIVAKGERAAYQRVAVKIGQGAQPPPPGPTPPGPEPEPPPGPTAEKLSLAVVYDPTQITPDAAIVLNAHDEWKAFATAGHNWKTYGNKTSETAGKAALELTKSKSVDLPALVIGDASDGRNLAVLPLPETVSALKTTVEKYVKK